MSRPPRAAEGGLIHHALNRANARLTIFDGHGDFAAFERTSQNPQKRFLTPLLPQNGS